jgi:hypothetical protein
MGKEVGVFSVIGVNMWERIEGTIGEAQSLE